MLEQPESTDVDIQGSTDYKRGMISVAEQPATPPKQPRRRPTPETRRNARRDYVQGKGSQQAIADRYGVNVDSIKAWSKAEEWPRLRQDFNQQELDKVKVAPPPAAPPPPPVTPQVARVVRIEQQMEKIELAMDKAQGEDNTPNAATLRDLSAAHARLFDAWCVLTGTPRPGVRKVGKLGRLVSPVTQPTEPAESSVSQPTQNQPTLI